MKRPRIFVIRVAIIVFAFATVWATWRNLVAFPRTEDAEVRANVAGVAAQVGGSITQLHVVDNQKVKKGDLLLELDPRPYEAEAARARARLDLVRMEVLALDDAVSAADAALRDRAARAEYAVSHYQRLQPLLAGNFASTDRVERARAEAESASALVREGEAAVARARKMLGEFEGRNTRIDEAAAALRDAELRVSYCRVFAPCDGYVTNLQISAGAYAAAGSQVFSIVDDSVWYVLANFRETDLARIQVGQQATVYLMSDRGHPVAGIVQGIARAVYPLATASRATPGGEVIFARVEPTFDFVQLAQRFPVRIVLETHATEALRMGGKSAVIVDTTRKPEPERLRRWQPREDFTPPVPQ